MKSVLEALAQGSINLNTPESRNLPVLTNSRQRRKNAATVENSIYVS